MVDEMKFKFFEEDKKKYYDWDVPCRYYRFYGVPPSQECPLHIGVLVLFEMRKTCRKFSPDANYTIRKNP